MIDDTPGIGVELSISTEGALAELLRFGQMFDARTLEFVRQASQMEKAVGGSLTFTGAAAKTKAFADGAVRDMRAAATAVDGVATATGRLAQAATRTAGIEIVGPALTREAENGARAVAKTEREINNMVRAIERETAATGRSKEQQREARLEELSATAVRQGNIDAADRLLAATRNLGNARRAVAEDQFYAAEKAAAAAAREQADAIARGNAELLERARLQAALDRTMGADRPSAVQGGATFSALAERERFAELAQKEAAAIREATEAQRQQNAQLAERARIEGALARISGADRPRATDAGATFSALAAKAAEEEARALKAAGDAAAKAAREHAQLAAAVRGSHDAQMADAEAAERLRMATDPLYAAVKRLNAEIAESTRLYHAGATAPAEYARQQEVLAGRLRDVEQAHHATTGAMGKAGRAAKLTQGDMLNLGYQMNDIVVSLVSGQKPLMVFAQQGAQIGQISAQSGVGLGGMAKAVGSMAGRFAAAHPLMIGFAVAAGTVALAVNALADKLTKDADIKGYAASLGLTREEMKKLKDVHVTFGDVMRGYWKTIDDAAGVSKMWKEFKDAAGAALAAVGQWILETVTSMAAGFAAAFDTIKQVWTKLPAILGDASVQAANAAIRGIESLVNASIDGLNGLAAKANDLTGLKLFGRIGNVEIAEIKNQWAGAGGAAMDAFGDNYEKRRKTFAANLKKGWKTLTDNIVGETKERLDKQAAAIKADRTPEKPKADRHAEALAREADATEAQIRNLYALAKANGESGAAALIAEARVKAESAAINKRADIEERVERQIRLAVAERVSNAAKATAGMVEQARATEAVNAAVAAGLVPAAQAAQLVKNRIADLPLEAALEAAKTLKGEQGVLAVQAATRALDEQRAARTQLTAAERQALFDTTMQTGDNRLAELREELRLVGATDAARERALVTLRATQEAQAKFAGDPAKQKAYVEQQQKIVAETQGVAAATRDWNEALSFNADRWDLIARNVQDGARGMADAFGDVGRAIGDMTIIYADYRAEQERTQAIHLANLANAKSQAAVDRENAKYTLASGTAQIRMFGDMAAAAKGFFKEKSGIYKALSIAEKAYRAIQFAMSVQAMVQDARETIMSVLNSGKRSIAAGTEGVANQSKLPFPYNVVAMAATAAALVSAGVAVFGGGGGGASMPKSAEDWQKEQGVGSVLGDGTAKSESLGRSLELMTRNSNKDLEYSSEMVRALRAIEGNIGNLAAAVSRQLGVGGGLDASSLQLGANTSGGLFGVGGLFSKKITRELNDAGLQFDGTSVASAIAGGISANLYQEVLKTTKKSGLFGIGGSTKTTVETTRTAADAGLTTEVALLIGNMRKAIVEAAGTIGIDGAAAMLDAFQINIGRISFKDLTSEEIEAELAAVFSRVGDDMAGAVGGGLSAFQRAGEGMLETLVRLAKEYQTVDVALRSIGMTFGAVGLSSVAARTALVDLFGGLDAFTEQTAFFRENFLSEAEQMAPVIAAVKAEMERLGLAGVTTKDAFKAVVLGLDLSTESGRTTYAALMAVAPAFAKTSDYLASLNGELKESAKTAEQLAAIEKQRRGLEIQLMEATGNAAGALAAKRADDLAVMDESLRALQQSIWVAQDAAEAARAAAAIAQQRRGLEIALMEATGDATGALAARRADELATMDASLRSLREQVWAAEAATAAQTALAEAQAAAAQAATALAQQRRSMEIELMEALGDAAGAMAARRADELAGTDASLRSLREQIYAAQDAATANAALASAQAAAAEAARTAADAAAQLARQRAGLEIALMRAQGLEAQAVTAERALELEALDASLRGLQAQVWAAEDARAAAEAAGRAQADMLAAAKQAADDAEQLRKQRVGMQAELLEAMGDAAGALALRRGEELAAMDASLRGLQELIWRQQDIAAATSKARDVLTDSYKRESDALAETIDRFGGFGESLRKFRGELGMGDTAVGDAYRAAQARFVDASSLAAMGDAKALGELEGISKEFLAASRDRAGSLAEYQRDIARVAGSVDRAIGATDEAVDYAQAQLEALKTSVTGILDVNENVVSVRDAILSLRDAEAGRSVPAIPAAPVTAMQGDGQTIQLSTAALERRIDELSQRIEVQNTTIAENTGKLLRLHTRWGDDGVPTRPVEDAA